MIFFSKPPQRFGRQHGSHALSQPHDGATPHFGSAPQVASQQLGRQHFARAKRSRIGVRRQHGSQHALSQPHDGATPHFGSTPQVTSQPHFGSQQRLRWKCSRWPHRGAQHDGAASQPQPPWDRMRSSNSNACALDAEAKHSTPTANAAGKIARLFMERAPHNQETLSR